MKTNLKRFFMIGIVSIITVISFAIPTNAYAKGDANRDGKLNVQDAVYIAQMLSKGKANELPDEADYNSDSKVNIKDAVDIAKKISQGASSKTTTVKQTTAKGIPSVVYITPTGKKYHYSSTCNGGTYTAIKYADAIKKGYTPCKKCVS